jgi:hypothetical protein
MILTEDKIAGVRHSEIRTTFPPKEIEFRAKKFVTESPQDRMIALVSVMI